ncbi:MAG TPA: heme-copper oxidase subunit III [Acidimicrobiia bacterium]|jgi:cytochrome c oxidase subunit 3/cytochrome o ubiquinol oxidase subunit 3|nr:heme-copper oxidase subunit III [Acidimicrobiia bacterium]
MATHTAPDPALDAHAGGHDVHKTRKTAMWVFLGSECLFFGSMIATFLLYRNTTEGGPGAELFNVPFTSASSFVLLMSSLTMVLAHNAFERKDSRQGRVWLAGTALLGSIFLAGQIFEFTEFVHEGLTLSTSPFGSSFYMLTGFHGAHVAIGVMMLAAMFILSLTGRLNDEHGLNVELVGLYWHFVDIVWIVIFTVIYLLQV